MSIQEESIRQASGRTGANFQKLDVELVHSEVFQCGAQNPRIPRSTSRGFPNNEAASAKERRLKLPEGPAHLLSTLHTGALSKISFKGRRHRWVGEREGSFC